VIMLGRIANCNTIELPVETFNILHRKIVSFQNEPVNAAVQSKTWPQQIRRRPSASLSLCDLVPTPVSSLEFKPDQNSAGRPAGKCRERAS